MLIFWSGLNPRWKLGQCRMSCVTLIFRVGCRLGGRTEKNVEVAVVTGWINAVGDRRRPTSHNWDFYIFLSTSRLCLVTSQLHLVLCHSPNAKYKGKNKTVKHHQVILWRSSVALYTCVWDKRIAHMCGVSFFVMWSLFVRPSLVPLKLSLSFLRGEFAHPSPPSFFVFWSPLLGYIYIQL